MDKLLAYRQILRKKQKKELLSALQTGNDYTIKPKVRQLEQRGSGLGTILASTGIPMLLNALTGKDVRGGAALQTGLPPQFGYPQTGRWPKIGRGKKRGPKSPFNNIPIVGAII